MESRKRNLQGFLVVGSLCVKLLWFPLVKYWIRQSQTGHNLNRKQRKYYKKIHKKYAYWIIENDRVLLTIRNLFFVDLI